MDFVEDVLRDELGFSGDDFARLYEQATVIPFEYNGEVTGATVLFGNEIHFMAAPGKQGRCGTRKELMALFKGLLDEHTFLTTRIPILTPYKDRTGERLGFTYTWSDDRFDYYICTDLPFGRKPK
jgi:hypothetical protein